MIFGKVLNLKKLAVEGVMGPTHTIWGIVYHLERITLGVRHAWVELTASKRLKIKFFLRADYTKPGLRVVALKDHQILAGNVQWWSVCAPALP